MCGAGSRRLPRLSRPLPAAWRAAFPGMPRDATWFMLVFDVLFPLPFLTLSLVGTVQGWNPFFGDLSGPLPHVVWPMLLTVPCLMRRLDPDAAAWSFVAIALLQLLFGPALLTIDIFAAPMLFTAIVYGSRTHARDFIMAAALMTCIASAFYGYSTTAISMTLIARINGEQPPVPSFTLMWDSQRGELLSGISGGIVTIGICIIVAITTGLWRRATRESAALLREHNRILERTQQDAQREAAIRERARIARDMHDVVAHTLSTIIVQADAGRYAGTQDLAMARRTMETIRRETTHAQHDMNQLLGVLNVPQDAANASHGAHMTPDVGYDAIPRLISQACLGPGAMAVTHAVLGRPSPESLSANGSICAFRVVQEALTNARKYAAGSLSADTQAHARHTAHTTIHVAVTESWDCAPRNGDGGGLHLSVTDDGIGAASGTDGHQPGFGLLGMRERVDALGGSLQAGPRSALEEAGTPGFRVDAFIPFESRGSSDLSEDPMDAPLPGDASLPASSAGASGTAGTVNGDATTVAQSPAGMRHRPGIRIAKRRKYSAIERMARWSMRHPLAVDTVMMMIVALAKSSVIGSTGIQPRGLPVGLPFTVLATVLMLLPCVPLCMRRTKPDLSCMLIFAACMVELTFIGGEPEADLLPVALSLYSGALYGTATRTRRLVVCSAVGSLWFGVNMWVVALPLGDDGAADTALSPFGLLVGGIPQSVADSMDDGTMRSQTLLCILITVLSFLVCLTFLAAGSRKRTSADNYLLLDVRREALIRERAAQEQSAAAEERTRISAHIQREASSTLTRIALMAQEGSTVLDSDPTPRQIIESFQSISAEGRRALRRMRELLGVLRGTSGGTARTTDAAGNATLAPSELRPAAPLADQLHDSGLQHNPGQQHVG